MEPLKFNPEKDGLAVFPVMGLDRISRNITECPSWSQIRDLTEVGWGRIIGEVIRELEPKEDYLLWNYLVWERRKYSDGKEDFFNTNLGPAHIHAATKLKQMQSLVVAESVGPMETEVELE